MARDATVKTVLFQSLVRVVLNEHRLSVAPIEPLVSFQSLVRVVLNEHFGWNRRRNPNL